MERKNMLFLSGEMLCLAILCCFRGGGGREICCFWREKKCWFLLPPLQNHSHFPHTITEDCVNLLLSGDIYYHVVAPGKKQSLVPHTK